MWALIQYDWYLYKKRRLGHRRARRKDHVNTKVKVAQSCLTLPPHGLQPARLFCPWNSPGKNTGVGSCSLLHGILPTQGSNPGFLHFRQIVHHLRHQGIPRILEWVAYPFSRGSSWPRNWTGVSCIAGVFFTSWATREADVKTKEDNYLQTKDTGLRTKSTVLCFLNLDF